MGGQLLTLLGKQANAEDGDDPEKHNNNMLNYKYSRVRKNYLTWLVRKVLKGKRKTFCYNAIKPTFHFILFSMSTFTCNTFFKACSNTQAGLLHIREKIPGNLRRCEKAGRSMSICPDMLRKTTAVCVFNNNVRAELN